MLKKRLIFLRKRPDLSFQAFNEHWAGPHGDIVLNLPGLTEYVQNPVVRYAGTPDGERLVDGLAELWDDNDADPATAARVVGELQDDEPRFLDSLTGFSVTNLDSYDPEAKVWVIGDQPFNPGLFAEAVASSAIGGVLETEPTNGRLMNRPGLLHEPAAPQRILTIGTTHIAAPAVHEAALQAAENAALPGRIRVLLTHSRRIL
ncbi:EthD family reductase [Streptomyces sp. MMS24-I2-30]|uniref:EthD family reductase n=1 Tax=Streptomyces sp. MMS24-I2-30 TaxID=3351564 RepID=UPI0038969249